MLERSLYVVIALDYLRVRVGDTKIVKFGVVGSLRGREDHREFIKF
jgi:hypothetical protein